MDNMAINIPESVVQDTRAFREEIDRVISGASTPAASKPIFAAMGIYEQRESGTYMVRVRRAAGRFLPHQARRIAELSLEYGNGIVHVTTRQDMQIHRVLLQDLSSVLEGLLEVSLATRGGGGDTVRNVSTCLRAGACVDEAFDVTPYATALTEYLLRERSNFRLPRKFKVALSGCHKDCGLCCVADLGFFAHVREGSKGFSVFAGGGMGKHSALAVKIEEFISSDTIFEVAEAVKRIFEKHGDRTNRHKARLRFVVERAGAEEFRRLYHEELAQVHKEKLAVPRISDEDHFAQPVSALVEEPADLHYAAWKTAQVSAQKQEGLATVRVPLHLGDISASELAAAAGMAEKYGDRTLRTTQEQDVQLRGVASSDLPAIYAELKRLDKRLTAGPSIRCVSCTGASTCKMGLRLSRGLAKEVEKELAGLECRFSDLIRISGCPNSCGHHPIAKLGLYGGATSVDGKLVPHYTIVAGGRTGEEDAALAQPLAKIPARAVPALLKEFFSSINTDVPDHQAAEHLRELAKKHERVPSYEESPEFYRDFGADSQ